LYTNWTKRMTDGLSWFFSTTIAYFCVK
jgi:hypothetical protein